MVKHNLNSQQPQQRENGGSTITKSQGNKMGQGFYLP
jgi:hypothetical protein